MRRTLTYFMASVIAFLPAGQALSQSQIDGSIVATCQTASPRIKPLIENIFGKVFDKSYDGEQLEKILNERWNNEDLDSVLKSSIQDASEKIGSDATVEKRLASLTSEQSRKEIVEEILHDTLEDPRVASRIETVVGGATEFMAEAFSEGVKASSPDVISCMEFVLTARYGEGFGRLIIGELRGTAGNTAISQVDTTQDAQLGLENFSGLVSGAVLVALRRQIVKFIAKRIATRILGGLIAKLAGYFVPIIGLVLMGLDLWALRRGTISIIGESMADDESISAIRSSVISGTTEGIRESKGEFASAAATIITEKLNSVVQAHQQIASLAERHEWFRDFLIKTESIDIARTSGIVSIIYANEKSEGVKRGIEDGSLMNTLITLNLSGVQIAVERNSVSEAMTWHKASDGDTDRVQKLGLHKQAQVSEEDIPSLHKVLAISEAGALKALVAAPRHIREWLVAGGEPLAIAGATNLSHPNLVELNGLVVADAIEGLTVIRRKLINNPSDARNALREGAAKAIIASSDQRLAVERLATVSSFSWASIPSDFVHVLNGKLSLRYAWLQHPLACLLFGVLFLMMVMSVLRLFLDRRSTVVIAGSSSKA